MIASLRGRLAHKDAEGVIVDCNGVGYGVAVSLTSLSRLGAEGNDVELLIHTQLTQDALRLYGFVDDDERQTFSILITTKGVGPKLALAILSTMSPAELADVVGTGDKDMLTRIPGVGNKTAERLLLELKDRLAARGVRRAATVGKPARGELVSALTNLGFKQGEADDVARLTLEEHPGETDTATLVRLALRSTTRV
ncbi:MAG: Holliday junction branch migration protein RuvA [Myxococcota bacterium]